MLICMSKKTIQTSAGFVKRLANFADDIGESAVEAKKIFLNDQDNKKSVKSLKIAILGLPNVGKSTLINQLIGRPICATSSKVHTTRRNASAIFCCKETQLVFIDTPGFVSKDDLQKYKLEDSFKNDVKKSILNADVIGVVQDISNVRARESFENRMINLFKICKIKSNAILILNKVDTLENKKLLLKITKNLTGNVYPTFSDVFMISALTGDGVSDLRNYFLGSAKFKNWEYKQEMLTDKSQYEIIQEIIKSMFLNNLPQELPYLVNVTVEHIENSKDGSINAISSVSCSSLRIARIVIGKSGKRITNIAKEAEQALCAIFQTAVRLKVTVSI